MSVTTTMDHFILIVLSMCVAFVPRYLPMRIFASRKIPDWFNEWMKYVPVSLFTALVVKDVFLNTETYTFVGFSNIAKILASLIVIAVSYFSRSMGLAVVVGLIAVALLSVFVPV
ncbi:branched-chain amino acid transporter [Ligilactobacillus salitolerans]|uniref:Branched-chain amino acid transporter n=1 Tax=Ligilactobacillus salitolerans TaxID=1808352 RepID=A0A401IRS2_9LACO|nr:AzlD domain-containing protein [Ligilactobacillus salitolerans]GBG94232.1 branched-chain amino acid transporter [Ligilactobacillus salitolerans]